MGMVSERGGWFVEGSSLDLSWCWNVQEEGDGDGRYQEEGNKKGKPCGFPYVLISALDSSVINYL